MTLQALKEILEEIGKLPSEGVGGALKRAFEEVAFHGIEKVIEAFPGLLYELTGLLMDAAVVRGLCEDPDIFDRFMDIFWEGVRVLSHESPWMPLSPVSKRDFKVNIEASDSPLRGHFEITSAGVTGGAGLLPFREQDFRFFGTTSILLHLLRGELPMGLGEPALQTEGHPALLPRLSPAMKGLSTIIRGGK